MKCKVGDIVTLKDGYVGTVTRVRTIDDGSEDSSVVFLENSMKRFRSVYAADIAKVVL